MKLLTYIATTITLMLMVSTSASADATMKGTYKVSAEKLWALVEFHQPSENIMPPIASSKLIGKGVGARKINKLDGDGEILIQLVYINPEKKAFNYVIRSGPIPVKNYVGEVRVKDLGDGRAELSWSGVYDPDGVDQAKADETIMGFYKSIFGKIAETYTKE